LLPKDADLWTSIARVHGLMATWTLEGGGAPRKDLARAEEALARAQALNPRLSAAWRYLGELRTVRARWLARRQQARSEDFEEAAKAFSQALELAPGKLDYHLAAGHLQREWAAWKKAQGEDPSGALTQGLTRAEVILSARPRWARARVLSASVRLPLAETLASAEQRQAWRDKAREDLEGALSSNPHLVPAWENLFRVSRERRVGAPTP
jgi:tetratricopeptide (TPR) repeat protein